LKSIANEGILLLLLSLLSIHLFLLGFLAQFSCFGAFSIFHALIFFDLG
jgi:hypothetical protein